VSHLAADEAKFFSVSDKVPSYQLPLQEMGSPYFVRIDPLSGRGSMAIDIGVGYLAGETTRPGGGAIPGILERLGSDHPQQADRLGSLAS